MGNREREREEVEGTRAVYMYGIRVGYTEGQCLV